MSNKINRSDFLKTLIVSITAALLNSCKRILTSTPTPTALPTATNTPTPRPTFTPKPSPTPTPTCLRLLEPEDGATFLAIGKNRFIWESYPTAAEYRFELTLPNGNTIHLGDTTNTFRDQYLEVLEGGEYQWQVSALDEEGNIICKSQSFIFTKPTAPSKNQSPGNTQNNDSGPAIPPPTDPRTKGSGT